MADTQPNSEVNTGLNGMAGPDMEQLSYASVMTEWESNYMNRMVELGRMKPYCLQLDASLVEVMDPPPPPAHAWTSGIVTDIIHSKLPDLSKAAVAGDGVAILFFGSRVFGEGLFPHQAEEYDTSLSSQIEWVGQLVLLMATPLLLTEGRQTLTRYKAMIRASQCPVIPAFPPMGRKSLCYYYSDMESDEDLVGNAPSVASNRASSAKGTPGE